MMLTETEKTILDQDGVLIWPDFFAVARLQVLRERVAELYAAQGEHAGSEFKQEPQTDRLANLVDHGALFEAIVSEPRVLAAVAHVLGDDFKLSSLNARSARPHSDWAQPLHCDTGALPDARGNKVCNVIWLLDDFTATNGATRYVPGTQHAGRLPQDVLPDASAPHPQERLLLAQAGTIAVMNAHTWHGGTANRSDRARLALHAFYCRADQPQQQYQKRLLSPATQQTLTPALRKLLALDDPQNDALCAQTTSMSGFLR